MRSKRQIELDQSVKACRSVKLSLSKFLKYWILLLFRSGHADFTEVLLFMHFRYKLFLDGKSSPII